MIAICPQPNNFVKLNSIQQLEAIYIGYNLKIVGTLAVSPVT